MRNTIHQTQSWILRTFITDVVKDLRKHGTAIVYTEAQVEVVKARLKPGETVVVIEKGIKFIRIKLENGVIK